LKILTWTKSQQFKIIIVAIHLALLFHSLPQRSTWLKHFSPFYRIIYHEVLCILCSSHPRRFCGHQCWRSQHWRPLWCPSWCCNNLWPIWAMLHLSCRRMLHFCFEEWLQGIKELCSNFNMSINYSEQKITPLC